MASVRQATASYGDVLGAPPGLGLFCLLPAVLPPEHRAKRARACQPPKAAIRGCRGRSPRNILHRPTYPGDGKRGYGMDFSNLMVSTEADKQAGYGHMLPETQRVAETCFNAIATLILDDVTDPTALIFVGPPGMKTTILNTFEHYGFPFYRSDGFTTKAFCLITPTYLRRSYQRSTSWPVKWGEVRQARGPSFPMHRYR